MTIIINIGKFILNIIYTFIKLFKVKNKITMISRQSNNINIDFKLLKDEINKSISDYEVVILCKKIENGLLNKISYVFHMFKQMYHIATSKVVILDSYCICISVLKHKKSLKVVQMWHALGAFKKFGKSLNDTSESKSSIKFLNKMNSIKLAEVMKMHNNYNYILVSSKNIINEYKEAFGYTEDIFKVYPLPRLDLVKDSKNIKKVSNKILKEYPTLKSKKNILYCPTFRKDATDIKYIKKLIDSIDYTKYNLILKLHPLTKYPFNDKRIIKDNKFATYEMGMVADYIITDYSAVIYELSFLNKPIYFYAYDLEVYIDKRDFYLDYEKDIPGKKYKNIEDLIKSIEKGKYDYIKLINFRNKYIAKEKVTYTKDLVLFIKSLC